MEAATGDLYALSLHDALPICRDGAAGGAVVGCQHAVHLVAQRGQRLLQDRKSTRLNSSHQIISYAVFCLKKKNMMRKTPLGKVTLTSHWERSASWRCAGPRLR